MEKTQAKSTVCPAQIRIGTRGSQLALAQANEVKNRLLGAFPELTQEQIEILKITTTGDKLLDKNLAEIGGKGLFTKEVEEALYEEKIDIAVHSMKDMPDKLPEGMIIDCILEREDPRDAFISNKAKNIDDLPEASVVGTSSVRRQSQLLALRPDLNVVPFRGNVVTRLDKLDKGEVDATFLALAGLKRIGLDGRVTSIIEQEQMLPAVAQGAIGVECLQSNEHIQRVLEKINHEPSRVRVEAERAFLIALGGSCTTPIGALAEISGDKLTLRTLIATPDGKTIHKADRAGTLSDAAAMGEDAGKELREKTGNVLQWRPREDVAAH
jgi:hydroxymethylbilane synthase